MKIDLIKQWPLNDLSAYNNEENNNGFKLVLLKSTVKIHNINLIIYIMYYNKCLHRVPMAA